MITCVYCNGRVDVDEGGPFYWVPLNDVDEPSLQLAEPVVNNEPCCGGPEHGGTPQAAYDRACGVFE